MVALDKNSLIVFYPLLFKIKRFKFSDIKSVNWSIYGRGRSLDYLRMNITFKTKESIFLSDQELENFSKIESDILKEVKVKPSLKNRSRLKKNKLRLICFIVFLGLVLSGFFSWALLNNIESGYNRKLSYLSIIPLLIFIRILIHTINYIKILRK